MTDMNAQAAELPIEKLKPFEGHPFQVKDDAEMEQLILSIATQGLLRAEGLATSSKHEK